MSTVIAVHTIHRVSKTKGQQDVVTPGTQFECSGKELDDLVSLGAVRVLEDVAPAAEKKAPRKATKAKSEPEPEPAPAADDDLEL